MFNQINGNWQENRHISTGLGYARHNSLPYGCELGVRQD